MDLDLEGVNWEAVAALRRAIHGSRKSCRFFAMGACRNGENCQFLHDQQSAATKSPLPCTFFARGACLRHDTCRFVHDVDSLQTNQLGQGNADEDASANPVDDDLEDDFIRPISGGVVQFGDGASITTISLDADYSSVRLSNLRRHSTKRSVVALLSKVGIDTPLDSIRVSPMLSDKQGRYMAEVRAKDPEFATAVCNALRSTSYGIEATAFATTLSKWAFGSGHRRSTTKKVHVSWFRPTKSVWLKFKDKRVARASQTFFDSGEYKILGQEVRTSRLTRSRDTKKPNFSLWVLQLVSVPAEATEDLIRDCFESGHMPNHIGMSAASYEASDEDACAAVRGMLAQIGPLEWWETPSAKEGKRLKTLACFVSESDARAAASALNNATAPFSQNVKLAVNLASSTKFKVLARIYRYLVAEYRVLKAKWETQGHLHFYEYPVNGRFKSIKIEGRQSQDVVNAAAELEALLAGTVASNDDGNLWSPSLDHCCERLHEISKETGVVVIRDTKKCHIRVIGPEMKRIEAIRLIARMLDEDTSLLFTINLTDDQYEWAQRGGFKAIVSALGRKIVKFDMVANPKRVLITGSKRDHDRAVEMISLGNVGSMAPCDTDTCSICWCEAEEPVVTTCGHQYCLDCFDRLAHSDASSMARVECKGAHDTCKKTVSLHDLHRHLSSSAFETVLKESLKKYLDSHPLDFRHCTTPECTQIYRVASSGVHNCTECLAVTCKTCNEAHAGMTCGEHRDFNSEGQQEFRRAKWQLGAKDCPRCRAVIEKTEGCNHITCRCGAHICWRCLKTFSGVNLCYNHLFEVHGGIGLE